MEKNKDDDNDDAKEEEEEDGDDEDDKHGTMRTMRKMPISNDKNEDKYSD